MPTAPIPVVIVAGLHADVRAQVAQRMLAGTPGSLAVHHDLDGALDGALVRVVRDAYGVLDRVRVPLAHGCVSCTLRDDTVHELVRRADFWNYRLLIVETWDSVEPRLLAEAIGRTALDGRPLSQVLRLAGVTTVVDADQVIADISDGRLLADHGLAAAVTDGRYTAEVLARQIEYATTIAIWPGESATETATARALAEQLNPDAVVTESSSAGFAAPVAGKVDVEERAAALDPASARTPCEHDGPEVATLAWRRLRPLHPERLFDALEELVVSAPRSRGRFWLASRPDMMLTWDAAGGSIAVEEYGHWLAALPASAWEEATPQRRAAAALDWDPLVGDRIQHLCFTGPGIERARIRALLDSCLLSAEELQAGRYGSSALPDPFAELLDAG